IAIQSFDYLLQPASKEELRAVLENALSQLKIERKNNQLMQLGQLFEDNQMDILDGNAMRYFNGLTDNSSFLKHLIEEGTGHKAEELLYMPVLVQVIENNRRWQETDRNLLRSIYYNVVNELSGVLSSTNLIILRNDSNGSFFWLLCFERADDDLEDICQVMENIRVIFQRSLKLTAALYYGNMCRFEGVRDICKDILSEQGNNVANKSSVYPVGQLSNLDVDVYSLESLKVEWRLLLERKELLRFKDSVFRFLTHKKSVDDLNREALMKLHQAVTELILSYMVNNNINSNDVFKNGISYTDFMYCWSSSDEFSGVLSAVVDNLCRLGNDEDIIAKVISFIDNNMDKELYVSEIADYVGMNPEYLTRYFKKEQGMSLKRYIDTKRILKAKELLEETDMSVTDIADNVGFSSYNSFTRAFKNHTGIAPTSFRDTSRKM
ncbi:MAG: helix-turn-helix transcriptional regulator, partial [Lachnospiraceae bacterium]|nr:helix-turn-helix transcriptional regulator [Lachnospiraceae bacterium]